eukprot:jgi/Botrbrau1/14756/Bobra.0103s0006.1
MPPGTSPSSCGAQGRRVQMSCWAREGVTSVMMEGEDGFPQPRIWSNAILAMSMGYKSSSQ